MQDIETFLDALKLYSANNVLLVVFLLAIIYMLRKADLKQRKYYITVAIVAVCVLFNGITFAVVKRFGEESTYYRFFWILPITLLSAYLVVELFFELTVKKSQRLVLLFVFAVMLFTNYNQTFEDWTKIPSNVYQLDEDIIALGDCIDAHTCGERTILLANNEISSHMREYNANIIINPDGMYYLDDIINGEEINYIARNVMMFMDSNMAEYIAVEKKKIGTNRLFESIGCEKIGESTNYNLYYYDEQILIDEWALFDPLLANESIYVNSEYINIPGMAEQKDYLYVTDLWVDTPEEQKKKIIDLANELQVEALIINCSRAEGEVTKEFLDEELKELKVPYIYNNNGIQQIDNEFYTIACVYNDESNITFHTDKPTILISNKTAIEDAKVLSKDSPIIEVIVNAAGSKKEMLNEKILLYSAKKVSENPEEGFVTLLRLKGLERK